MARGMTEILEEIAQGQANLYARFHGLPDPFTTNGPTGDDRSAENEDRAKAVLEARADKDLARGDR